MKSNKFSSSQAFAFILMLFAFISGCKEKTEQVRMELPEISSAEVFALGSDAITIKSVFDVSGEDTITTIGICWSTEPNPTTENNFVSSTLNDSVMYARIEYLTPDTRYYARVYACNQEKELYSSEIEFTTNNTVSDIEGNIYNVVTLGSQTWMEGNLKTTQLNDGTAIHQVRSSTNWAELDAPGYCLYDYIFSNKDKYGALYNWLAVNSGMLCPEGWHVPTDSEWSTLAEYLGGEPNAGGFMKSTSDSWNTPNKSATDYSCFSGMPAGRSSASLGSFTGEGIFTTWWSSTTDYSQNTTEGYILMRQLFNSNAYLVKDELLTNAGVINFLSVRCIKD